MPIITRSSYPRGVVPVYLVGPGCVAIWAPVADVGSILFRELMILPASVATGFARASCRMIGAKDAVILLAVDLLLGQVDRMAAAVEVSDSAESAHNEECGV